MRSLATRRPRGGPGRPAPGRRSSGRRSGRVRRAHRVVLVVLDVVGEAAHRDLGDRQCPGERDHRLLQCALDVDVTGEQRQLLERLPQPDLPAQGVAPLGVLEGQAGLDGEHLEQLALLLVRDLVVGRQVDRHVAEQLAGRRVERRVEGVEGVPGVRVVGGLEVGDPQALDLLRRQPVVRDEPQDAPVVRDRELAAQHVLGWRPPADQLGEVDRVARHRGHHERVSLQPGDRRDAVPQALDDALRDLLEDLIEVGRGADAADHLVEATHHVRAERVERPGHRSSRTARLRPR